MKRAILIVMVLLGITVTQNSFARLSTFERIDYGHLLVTRPKELSINDALLIINGDNEKNPVEIKTVEREVRDQYFPIPKHHREKVTYYVTIKNDKQGQGETKNWMVSKSKPEITSPVGTDWSMILKYFYIIIAITILYFLGKGLQYALRAIAAVQS